MDLLPSAQLALNSRPKTVINAINPFFLRKGYDFEPLIEPNPLNQPISRHPGAIEGKKHVERLRNAQDFAQAEMASAQQRNETNANLTRRQPDRFEVSDKVLLNLKNVKTTQPSKKLAWQHAKYTITAVPDA